MFEYLLLNMIKIYLMNDKNLIHRIYYYKYIYLLMNLKKNILFEKFYFLENLN